MKTSVYVGTSLDGFIAKSDGDISWLAPFNNKEVHGSYKKFIRKIDAIVIGRGTFETVLTFPSWPYQQKVFVLSTRLKQAPRNLKGKAIILSMRPKELLHYLAEKNFSNIYVDGGRVIQNFLREDCIDEMIITRVPMLLGSGIPLFGKMTNDLKFTHVKTSLYSNGLVKSYYKRNRDEVSG